MRICLQYKAGLDSAELCVCMCMCVCWGGGASCLASVNISQGIHRTGDKE